MKSKMKTVFTMVLMMFLMAAFTGEAQAKPTWLGIKVRSWSIVFVGQDVQLHLEIAHTNNSDNRIITNIYDKFGKFTLKKDHVYQGKKATAFTVLTLRSTKNNQVRITPGGGYTLIYNLPIKTVDNGLPGVPFHTEDARAMIRQSGWRLSYSYDCMVSSQPEWQGRR